MFGVEIHTLVEEDMSYRSHAHGGSRVTRVGLEGSIDLGCEVSINVPGIVEIYSRIFQETERSQKHDLEARSRIQRDCEVKENGGAGLTASTRIVLIHR